MKNELNGLERYYLSVAIPETWSYDMFKKFIMTRAIQIGNLNRASDLETRIFSYWLPFSKDDFRKFFHPRLPNALKEEIRDWKKIKADAQKNKIFQNVDLADEHLKKLEMKVMIIRMNSVKGNPNRFPKLRESPLLDFYERIDTDLDKQELGKEAKKTIKGRKTTVKELASKYPEGSMTRVVEKILIQLLRQTGDKKLKEAYLKQQRAKVSRFDTRISMAEIKQRIQNTLIQWKEGTLPRRMESFLRTLFAILVLESPSEREQFLQNAYQKAKERDSAIEFITGFIP